MYFVTRAANEYSNQSEQSYSLVRIFAEALWKVKEPRFLQANSELWSA